MRKSRDLPDIRTQTRNTRYIRPGSDVCACFCPLTSQNNPERNSLSSRMRCRAKLRPDTVLRRKNAVLLCQIGKQFQLPDTKIRAVAPRSRSLSPPRMERSDQDRKMPRLTVETGWRIASRPDNGFPGPRAGFSFPGYRPGQLRRSLKIVSSVSFCLPISITTPLQSKGCLFFRILFYRINMRYVFAHILLLF